MLADKNPRLLIGEVEIDETAIGGKEINRHASKKKGVKGPNAKNADKTMVGAIEKNGKVVTRHIPNRQAEHIKPFILAVVAPGSLLVSDEAVVYKTVKGIYVQQKVKHQKKEYVNKKGHTTNHIENYWSTLKRGIYGIYHQISEKHTQRYLDEFSFRFNSREKENEVRFCLALKQSDSRLTYQDLIGK